jgi:fructan beta-fructosidase
MNQDLTIPTQTIMPDEPATHTFKAEKHYLHLPVRNGAAKRRITVQCEGLNSYAFNIQLAVGDETPDFFAVLDLSRWIGRTVSLDGGKFVGGDKAFTQLTQSEQFPNSNGIYREKHRPQFHFTTKIGWLNDPNGLVYHENEWHLFYQHNPYGLRITDWNAQWGHAVSKDLFHWTQLDEAIYANMDCKGLAASGSAVIDHHNTSGFGKDGKSPLVIALTDFGTSESLAYSLDNGRTFTMFSGNPVITHAGRDPKVIWHEPTRRWVLVVYDEFEKKEWAAFYASNDLKNWELQSRLEGYHECTDLFELPVKGEANKTRWVVYAADGKYAVGHFDGKVFTPEHEGKRKMWYGNFYAGQTYDNAPDGRRVQMGWLCGYIRDSTGTDICLYNFPGMPFNQQMTVPVELSLRSTPDGIRMFAVPVAELKTLRGKGVELAGKPLTRGAFTLETDGEGLDVEAEFAVGPAGTVNLSVCNSTVKFDASNSWLTVNGIDSPLATMDGKITLRMLVDRGSIEVFGNDGQVAIASYMMMDGTKPVITVTGSDAVAVHVAAWPLQSVWR